MKRSPLLRAVPRGVVTRTRPDAVLAGTVVDSEVLVVPDSAYVAVKLTFTRSFANVVSKFVPVIDSDAPATAIVGVKLLIVGASLALTTNDVALVADPEGGVTTITPVVAPLGTAIESFVVVAVNTVADTPLNVTVFRFAVALNPVPKIVTGVPTGPEFGVNSIIETVPADWRVIDSRFPTAS
jgi:hypothetical protein